MATKKKRGTKRSAGKKSARRGAAKKRSGAKKSSAKRGAKKAAKRRSSPMTRVKRVASGVAEQAQSAVVSGYEAVKDIGENIIDRVSG